MDIELLLSSVNAEHVSSLEIVAKIANDMKELKESKSQLQEIVAQLTTYQASVDGRKFIHMNVGSDIMTINSASIQQHVDETYLFALISGRYDKLLPKDKNGRIFLDLDVRWVEPQFNWLRDMVMWNGEEKSLPKLSGVQTVLVRGHEIISRYFQSEHQKTTLIESVKTDWLSAQSNILRDYPASNEAIRTMISSDSDYVSTAKLLYRCSRDGLTAASFHKHCDGHKNTLCVIRDIDGGIFGGFTGDVAWKTATAAYEAVKAPNAFLFSLVRDNVTKSCHCRGLGRGFECNDKGKFPVGSTDRSELEIFEIEFVPKLNSGARKVETTTDNLATQTPHNLCMDPDIPPQFAAHMQCRSDASAKIIRSIKTNRLEMQQLCDQAVSVLNELKFVAKFVGIKLPAVVHKDEEDSVSDMSELEKTLSEIRTFVRPLTVGRAETSSDVVTSDASSIVYINAGGRKIATTKATLLQAPSGSILANMASDVWGHDLDSEGNIFQDVNPDLFTAVINHLRLKALLPASEVPPITVYAEQTAALDNLLEFYTIEDVKVESIRVSCECLQHR